MKQFITLLFIGVATTLFSQQIDYNTKKGFVAEGYDVVSYFVKSKPLKGKSKYQLVFDGAKFKFSTEKNLQLFKKNPKIIIAKGFVFKKKV